MIHRKYILLLLLLLPVMSFTVYAQTNRIYVNDIQMEVGTTGTLDVYMENTQSIVGFQFTLTMPQGFTLLTQNVNPSGRLANHQLVAQPMGGNKYMFAAFSPTNEAIGAIQGVLFSIPVQVAANVKDNVRYELTMTDAVMGIKNGDNVLGSAYGGKIFVAGEPNLHVTALDCSDAVAGRKMTITWRVRNDGAGPTGDVSWKDYVWLTPDIQGGSNMTEVKLLRTVNNVTALQPGEWYDNSIEVELEERKYGKYHVVVTSDMYGFDKMDLAPVSNTLPEIYQPETGGYGFLYATGQSRYDLVQESGEFNGRSDNFFYKRINIAVPPLPNLRVDQIVAVVDNSQDGDDITPITQAGLASSTLFYSGKHVKVTALIKNTGDAPVQNVVVRDALYMSRSEIMSGTVYEMAVNNDTLNIPSGGEQLITFSTQLPYVWNGGTWFHVHVDTQDAVYEGAATTDNLGTGSSISCLQTPTADFKVTSLSVPKQVTLGTPFDITYKVQNVGPGIPFSSYWTDQIYINTTKYYKDDAPVVESHRQSGGFVRDKNGNIRFEGDSYTATRSVTLRDLKAGTYFLYIKVDANDDVYEFGGEDNNLSDIVVTVVVASDLTVQLLSVYPDTMYNNSQATFSWKVKNIGTGTIQNASLTDAFYASTPNGNNTHYLGRATNTVSLPPGGEKVLRANITLPNIRQLDGDMNVFVKTNTTGILESTSGNNISNSIQKSFKYEEEAVTNPRPPVSIGNRPNLVMTKVSAPSQLTAGQEADITYKFQNQGTGAVSFSFLREVFLSQSSELNTLTAIPCTIVSDELSSQSLDLLLNSSDKDFSMRIRVPSNIRGGQYYLHVRVNGDNKIDEIKYSDNTACTQVYVEGHLPDLAVLDLTVPSKVKTSSPFYVSWSVKNIGSLKSEKITCDVYLTANDKAVKLLKTVEINPLSQTMMTTKFVSVQLEDNIVGEYGILVVADSVHRQDELSRSNNRATSHLTVTQSPLPNLQLSQLKVDGRLRGGDSITVTALVTNIGNNSTHKEKWSDAFYLSTGYELNTKTDLRIGSKIHVGELMKNGSYELTAKLRIPETVHGYYLLYAVADDGSALIETSRTDNSGRASIFVEDINDIPAQLAVSHISAPATITAGAMTDISYSVVNNGLYPATGTLRDAIYLSSDNKWDENDIMIGVVEDEVDILPGQSLYRRATGRVTNVSEGEYYVIVRTNSTHSIVESDYDDNMCVETTTTRVVFSTLQVGSSSVFSKMGYFKVPVQSVGQSATIGFSLSHDADQQAGLYVAYERVPSTARFDYASTRLNTNSQEVLVPNVQPGTYYVLAQRNNVSSEGYNRWIISTIHGGIGPAVELPVLDYIEKDEHPMGISARDVQFGATRLSINQGGTDGWVTTEVQGALFDSIMDFRLVRNKEMIPIETLTYNDQTSARVTFNLNRAETGVYDVVSELPDGTQATMKNGFTVVPGVSSALGVRLDGPKVTRVNGFATLVITYANSGNTDVVVRDLFLTIDGGELGMTAKELDKHQKELHIIPEGKQDARGFVTIPPGKQETTTCYFRQTASFSKIYLYLVE